MNCPKCGVINNENAKFCGSCGNNLLENTQQPIIINNVNNNEEIEQLEIPVNTNVVPTQTPQQPVINNVVNEQKKSINNKKSKKNITIAIIIAIAIIAIVVSIIIFLPTKNTEEKLLENAFNQEQLIKVKNNDKYGYIDTTGKIVLKPKYEYASDFYGKYAIVRSQVTTDGLTTDMYQIIDEKGNVKLSSATSIEYLEEQDVWIANDELYNSSLKKINKENTKIGHLKDKYFIWVNSKEKQGGILTADGKIPYTYNFADSENRIDIEISDIDETLSERYAVVNINSKKYSIVNCDTGKIVYDFIEKAIYEYDDNIFKISSNNTYMYIQKDKVAYKTDTTSITLSYDSDGYLTIRDRNKPYSERYSYFDIKTETVSKDIPEHSSTDETETNEWEDFTKNKKFNCGSSYGLMNNETITLPCEWESLEYIEIDVYKFLISTKKEYIYGEKDNKWYLIDINTKKPIIEFNASYITQNDSSPFIYYEDKETNNIKIYNLLTNKSLTIEDDSSDISYYANYITVRNVSNKTIKYYNSNLELIYTEDI